jgi:hypothetical protein
MESATNVAVWVMNLVVSGVAWRSDFAVAATGEDAMRERLPVKATCCLLWV